MGDEPILVIMLDHGVRVLREVRPLLAATMHGYVSNPVAQVLGVTPVGTAPAEILDDIRARVGDDAYEQAVARGASIMLEELVAITLSELDRLLAESEALHA